MPLAFLALPRLPLHAAARMIAVAAALVHGGCATLTLGEHGGSPGGGTAAPARPANVEPPPPAINLSGFPLSYRQGYADGCTSAGGSEQKDAARFGADGNYRTGWLDGRSLCAKK